jgi:hypothetical protein
MASGVATGMAEADRVGIAAKAQAAKPISSRRFIFFSMGGRDVAPAKEKCLGFWTFQFSSYCRRQNRPPPDFEGAAMKEVADCGGLYCLMGSYFGNLFPMLEMVSARREMKSFNHASSLLLWSSGETGRSLSNAWSLRLIKTRSGVVIASQSPFEKSRQRQLRPDSPSGATQPPILPIPV